MHIGQILKVKGRSVVTARPDDTLQEVAVKLGAKKIGAVVVVGENGRVAGIISERDIIRAISVNGGEALKSRCADSMTRDVISCHEKSSLEDVMELMTRGRFRHVPVIDDDALVGIISIGDIVKNHIAEVELEVSVMRDYLASG